MNKEKFISFMQNPDSINKESMDELSYLINEFPYCQSAHILLTLSHFKEDNILFDSSLKTTAIYVGNRRILKKHIDRLSSDSKRFVFHDEGIVEKEKVKKDNKEATVTQEEKKTDTLDQKKTVADNKSDKESKIIKKVTLKTEPPMEKEPGDISKSRSLAELKKIVERRIREIEREKREKAGEIPKRNQPVVKSNDLIETFIKNQPGISRQNANFFDAKEVAASSIVDHDNIVSETLANIYMDQRHIKKAINIYQKLSLKFPEKSSYFAALIEKAEKEHNNKK